MPEMLSAFDYTAAWIDEGLISIDQLRQDYQSLGIAVEFREEMKARYGGTRSEEELQEFVRTTFGAELSSEYDPRIEINAHPGSYVLAHILRWIEASSPMEQAQIQHLLNLTAACEHVDEVADICWLIVDDEWLTDSQFELVCTKLETARFHRRARAAGVRRKLRRTGVTSTLCPQILRHLCGQEQAAIMRYRDHEFTDEDLALFVKHGTSRQSRETAERLLGERAYRKRRYSW